MRLGQRLVVARREHEGLACRCRTWGLVGRVERDYVLAALMEWAWLYYKVQLKLLARGEHVAICELVTMRPGEGRVRHVMDELCLWADCSRVRLELTPSAHWGADLGRLTRFYHSLGFQQNLEPATPFMVQEELTRYPASGRGHDSGQDRP